MELVKYIKIYILQLCHLSNNFYLIQYEIHKINTFSVEYTLGEYFNDVNLLNIKNSYFIQIKADKILIKELTKVRK